MGQLMTVNVAMAVLFVVLGLCIWKLWRVRSVRATRQPVEMPGLMETFRRHWRVFVPAWIAPYATMAAVHFFGDLGFFAFPALVGLATTPYLMREATYWRVAFWAMAVPFLIWIALVATRNLVMRFIH